MLSSLLVKTKGQDFSKRFYSYEYLLGRNAIYAALSQCKKLGYKRVLFPSYSCGDEIAVAVYLGYFIEFYNVDEPVNYGESLIMDNIKSKDILFLTHFFGIVDKSQKIADLVKKVKSTGGLVIEDAAYALFSDSVGEYGDFIVFTMRKNLPVPHGAVLCSKVDYGIIESFSPSMEVINKEINNFKNYKSGLYKLGSGKHSGINISDQYGARYKDYGGYKLGCSDIARRMINGVDIKSHVRDNKNKFEYIYNILANRLSEKNLSIAKNIIQESVYSQIFPIVVNNSSLVYEELMSKKIHCTFPFWNRLHPYLEWNKFNKSRNLKNEILALSLERTISKGDLSKISDIILKKDSK